MPVSTLFPFQHAYSAPSASALLKTIPEDFIVTETIAYSLSGEGEHVWCWVEKINQNSEWVAKQIAKFCGVTNSQMGVAGKKDKQAVTYQWMSCHLPGLKTPDFSKLNIQGVQVLKTIRHHKKLQTGGLSGNRFELNLTEVKGDKRRIELSLNQVKQQGFANYFGEQRFGIEAENLPKASAFFKGKIRPKRHQKTMYISAARSWLFNEILSQRIAEGSWNKYQAGDAFQLAGSQKWFVDDGDVKLIARLDELDIHPTGALFGKGNLAAKLSVAKLENTIFAQHPIWTEGLAKLGLKQERRALRVVPHDMDWHWKNDDLQLKFSLPAGSYATMLVREIFITDL